MKELKQWIVCNSQKVPVNVSGVAINPHEPSVWMTYDTVVTTAKLLDLHIGFVLTENDEYFCIDIDKQLDSPIAKQLLEVFDGCYIEKSVSGNGWHIFGKGKFGEHSKKNGAFGVELYSSNRFILITGIDVKGDSSFTPDPSLLTWLVDSYFPPIVVNANDEWSDEAVPEWSGPIDDEELITKMLTAKISAGAAFGAKATFTDLWEANTTSLSMAYPSQNNHSPYDQSSADMALAIHLAFWTGKHGSRIKRLMLKSKLYRDKWTTNKTYLDRTIVNAINKQTSVYNFKPKGTDMIPTIHSVATSPLTNEIQVTSWGELSKKHFEEMKWIINSFLPPGVSLIAGRPKQGKSWLVLAFGLLVAAGRPVFGYTTSKSDVLYMALEDSERRLQGRTRKLMQTHNLTDTDISGFHYCIDAPKLGDRLEDQIADKLSQHPKIRFVIIDVLARIRSPRRGNQSVYDADYEVGQRIKKIGSLYPEVAFLIVHHQNKGQGDALDSISGSHGLAGGFDNTYGLVRANNGLELHIDGRDIEDSMPIPILKGEDHMWTLASRADAAEIKNSDTRNAILNAMDSNETTPKQIAERTSLDPNTINSSLRRMTSQGILTKVSRGQYKKTSLPELSVVT